MEPLSQICIMPQLQSVFQTFGAVFAGFKCAKILLNIDKKHDTYYKLFKINSSIPYGG